MVAAPLRRARTLALLALWALVALAALVGLSLSAENSAQFERLQPLVLLASVAADTQFICATPELFEQDAPGFDWIRAPRALAGAVARIGADADALDPVGVDANYVRQIGRAHV